MRSPENTNASIGMVAPSLRGKARACGKLGSTNSAELVLNMLGTVALQNFGIMHVKRVQSSESWT